MYKYHLNDVDWREFFIEDLFFIHRGNAKNLKTRDLHVLNNTSIAILSSIKENNALSGFTTKNSEEKSYKNVITLNNNGNVGYSFYHNYEFIASSDVSILVLKDHSLNKEIGLFLTKCLEKIALDKFAFGYKASNKRVMRTKILLPINSDRSPNWKFMEEYIKERKNKQKQLLKEYLRRKSEFDLIIYSQGLNDLEWKEFFIGGNDGIFDIKSTKSGIDKNKLNTKNGNVPYITRSENNNGINSFITDDQNKKYNKDKGNVITIGLDTQTCFYQKNDFYTGQNIQVLRNDKLNKRIAMFIIPLLKLQMKKFNWGGNGATLTRLERTKILLPIDKQGNPNWMYMENFIKNIEQKYIRNLINFFNKSI